MCQLDERSSFQPSLQRTTIPDDSEYITIVFGIDKGDTVYDKDEMKQRLVDMFSSYQVEIIDTFRVGFGGRICWIWEQLAQVNS